MIINKNTCVQINFASVYSINTNSVPHFNKGCNLLYLATKNNIDENVTKVPKYHSTIIRYSHYNTCLLNEYKFQTTKYSFFSQFEKLFHLKPTTYNKFWETNGSPDQFKEVSSVVSSFFKLL